MKLRKFVLVVPVLLLLSTQSVFALDAPNFGGNNSSDYQPPTQNPQSNVATDLQPNNSSIQPTGQTTVNQQQLTQKGNLKVTTSPSKTGTSVTVPETDDKASYSWVWWLAGVALLAFILSAYLRRLRYNTQPVTVEPEPTVEIPVVKKKKHKTKKKKPNKTKPKRRR